MTEITPLGFAFAVVNFIVLAALLWKFLHKPVLAALEKRRQEIEAARTAADKAKDDAERTRGEYDSKLSEIAAERDRVLDAAREEADGARQKLLEKARQEADADLARRKQAFDREQADAVDQLRGELVGASVEMAASILSKLADDDIETKLGNQLLAELGKMADDADGSQPMGGSDSDVQVRVTSAKPLPGELRKAIDAALIHIVGESTPIDYAEDPGLVAGARVEFATVSVDASLADLLTDIAARVTAPQPGSAAGTEDAAS